MEPAPAKYTVSIRGGQILMDTDKFEYTKDKQRSGKQYWVCRKRKSNQCRATAITVPDQDLIVSINGNHNHSSEILKKQAKDVEIEHIKNAARNPNVDIRRVLGDISISLQQESQAAACSMSRMDSIKMQIYRARKSAAGEAKAPTCTDNIINMADKYKKLGSGEQFLISSEVLVDDNPVLIFASRFGKDLLANCSTWQMDGTFQTSPVPFQQIYVVFGLTR